MLGKRDGDTQRSQRVFRQRSPCCCLCEGLQSCCRGGALQAFPKEEWPGGGKGLFSGTDPNPCLLWGSGFLLLVPCNTVLVKEADTPWDVISLVWLQQKLFWPHTSARLACFLSFIFYSELCSLTSMLYLLAYTKLHFKSGQPVFIEKIPPSGIFARISPQHTIPNMGNMFPADVPDKSSWLCLTENEVLIIHAVPNESLHTLELFLTDVKCLLLNSYSKEPFAWPVYQWMPADSWFTVLHHHGMCNTKHDD